MPNNKDKSLDTIRKKLEEHEFDFQEQMWEKMEALLDTQDSPIGLVWGKTASFIYALLPALVILTFVSLLPPVDNIPIESSDNGEVIPTRRDHAIKSNQQTFLAVEEKSPLTQGKEIEKEEHSTAAIKEKKLRAESKDAIQVVNNTNPSTSIETESSNSHNPDDNSIISGRTVKALSVLGSQSFLLVSENRYSLPMSPVVSYPGEKKWTKHIGVTGGLALSKDNNPDKLLKRAGFLGLNYKASISSRWSINAGVLYGHTTMNRRIYSYYADTIVTPKRISAFSLEYDVRHIYFLEGTIALQYQIPQTKSGIVVGLSPAYIFNYDIDGHHNTKNSYFPEDKPENIRTIFANNDYGLNKTYLGITIGYSYQFSPSLSFHVNINQGFSDLSNDYFLRKNEKHRNTIVRFGGTYWFF